MSGPLLPLLAGPAPALGAPLLFAWFLLRLSFQLSRPEIMGASRQMAPWPYVIRERLIAGSAPFV